MIRRLKKITTILALVTISFTGCGKHNNTKEVDMENIHTDHFVTNGNGVNFQVENVIPEQSESEQSETQNAQEGESDLTYHWNEISITLPKEWKNKYEVISNENGFSLVQLSSYRVNPEMGFIVGITRSKIPYLDLPNGQNIAYTKDYIYYLQQATDVSFVENDANIANEYSQMYKYIDDIVKSVKIDSDNVTYHADEYVAPMSEYVKFSSDNLMCLNDNQLRIAKNEILAKHGCIFEDISLNNYFNSKRWYEGKVEEAEFDQAQLSEIEKSNYEAIEKAEKKYIKEHPYPMQVKTKEKISLDLNNDGRDETIQYKVKQVGYDYEQTLIINEKSYSLSDFNIYACAPAEDRFYITNISQFDEDALDQGLEIAILDYGPSDDLVTSFFRYDTELHYLGDVPGFPFMQEGNFDGFTTDGIIYGEQRLDLINTIYGYVPYQYNYEERRIEQLANDYYELTPTIAHKLLVDLPVYQELDETSRRFTIPKGEKVFFTYTDGNSWLKVKSSNGICGYFYVSNSRVKELNIDAVNVFTNLEFYD